MKICNECKTVNTDEAKFCRGCAADITNTEITSDSQSPSNQNTVPKQPVLNQPSPRQAIPQRPMINAFPQVPKKIFTWNDVSTIIGFVASIIGIFWSAIVLLPLGGVASYLGFRGNKTKGLAIAGLVISVIAIIIKICVVLYSIGVIPEWVTNGVFN